MLIRILTIGNKMPDWVETGYLDYVKRLPPNWTLELIEIPLEKRTKQADIARIKQREGEKLLAAIKPHHRIIALEVTGKPWTTEQLATQLQTWHDQTQPIDLLIGGPDGLAPECLQKAHLKWSLSPLTLPHPLVRIVLAEQIYRAYSILNNHPYHR
jgi:23S rRNA (pseudouridine1915-N3)-methyltransferase